MQRGVGGHRAEQVGRSPEPLPCRSHRVGERLDRRLAGRGSDPGPGDRVVQRAVELGVARRAQRAQQIGARRRRDRPGAGEARCSRRGPPRRAASPRGVRAARGEPRCRAPRPVRRRASAARRATVAPSGDRRIRAACAGRTAPDGLRRAPDARLRGRVRSTGRARWRRSERRLPRAPCRERRTVGRSRSRPRQASTLRALVRPIARSWSATCASIPKTVGTFV